MVEIQITEQTTPPYSEGVFICLPNEIKAKPAGREPTELIKSLCSMTEQTHFMQKLPGLIL